MSASRNDSLTVIKKYDGNWSQFDAGVIAQEFKVAVSVYFQKMDTLIIDGEISKDSLVSTLNFSDFSLETVDISKVNTLPFRPSFLP